MTEYIVILGAVVTVLLGYIVYLWFSGPCLYPPDNCHSVVLKAVALIQQGDWKLGYNDIVYKNLRIQTHRGFGMFGGDAYIDIEELSDNGLVLRSHVLDQSSGDYRYLKFWYDWRRTVNGLSDDKSRAASRIKQATELLAYMETL